MTPQTPNPDWRSSSSNHPRSLGALILIVLGTVLFLDNLGIAPFDNLRAYWPLALSAFGVAMLTRARSNCNMIWPWAMVLVGVLVTLGNLHYIRANWGNVWPVWLIAAGAGMLTKRNRGERSHWNGPVRFRDPGEPFRTKFSGGKIHENIVFSSLNRRVETTNFEGADLNATFGELKFDLRNATIATPNHQAIIETNVSFGAIKLRIPETWKIIVEGSAVFGTYEDKTVPPRPVPGVDPPTLIIRGNAAFGAVEIEN